MERHDSELPLNFAHRGASRAAPENTLSAFLSAVELGADGIEFDVQFSSDSELVVIHDFSLDKTTDGKGPVRARTLAQIQELDAGGWFAPSFKGERIPTLQQVLDAVGDRLLLNIELKTETVRDDGLAAAAVRVVEDNLLFDRAVVSSFNPLVIRRIKRLNPRISVGLLYAPDMPIYLRNPWSRHLMRLDALHPHHTMIDERYVDWARGLGYRVNTWTADEPGELRRLVRCGVDILITNEPDVLDSVLREFRE